MGAETMNNGVMKVKRRVEWEWEWEWEDAPSELGNAVLKSS